MCYLIISNNIIIKEEQKSDTMQTPRCGLEEKKNYRVWASRLTSY
jgi:hypothetical protein